MAAKFSRARESRRTSTTSGVRRGFAAVALTAGIAGFAALGMAGLVSSPAGAAPGNNGTVKVIDGSGADIDSVPNNVPHVGCTFAIQWWGFDADETASVQFELQAPTAGGLTVSGDQSPHIVGGKGGSVLDHVEAYTLTPAANVTPQPNQGYHVKVTINTPHSNGSDKKSKVFWFAGCGTPTTSTPSVPCVTQTVTQTVTETVTAAPVVPRKQARVAAAADPCAVTATVTQTATVTTTPVQNPCVTATVTATATVTKTVDARAAADPTCYVTVTDTATATVTNGVPNGGSPTIPVHTGGGNPESVYTPATHPSKSSSPQPGTVVPTRIESGLASLPATSGTPQHTDRWPLFALSGLTALLGAIGLLPRRRTSRRS